MSDDPLYRREILRLAADAKGAGRLGAPDASASLQNPACGDRVTVELTLEGGRIAALAHQTQACVLTQASASLLADMAAGKDHDGLTRLAARVRAMLAGQTAAVPGYEAFDGVAAYPGRHVCVLLPVEAALKALEGSEPRSSGTEG